MVAAGQQQRTRPTSGDDSQSRVSNAIDQTVGSWPVPGFYHLPDFLDTLEVRPRDSQRRLQKEPQRREFASACANGKDAATCVAYLMRLEQLEDIKSRLKACSEQLAFRAKDAVGSHGLEKLAIQCATASGGLLNLVSQDQIKLTSATSSGSFLGSLKKRASATVESTSDSIRSFAVFMERYRSFFFLAIGSAFIMLVPTGFYLRKRLQIRKNRRTRSPTQFVLQQDDRNRKQMSCHDGPTAEMQTVAATTESQEESDNDLVRHCSLHRWTVRANRRFASEEPPGTCRESSPAHAGTSSFNTPKDNVVMRYSRVEKPKIVDNSKTWPCKFRRHSTRQLTRSTIDVPESDPELRRSRRIKDEESAD